MIVKEVMRRAYVVDKDISLADAAKIMSSKGIGSIIIVLKGRVKGIVTERDLIKNFNSGGKISKVMSKNVVTITPDDEIESALELMKNNSIKRLPVVEENQLVGIVTLTDIMANADKIDEEFFFD